MYWQWCHNGETCRLSIMDWEETVPHDIEQIWFVRGIHRSPVKSPHKDQWRGALMFSLLCTWINAWVNNRETGYLRRHRAHYDVILIGSWPHLQCINTQIYDTGTTLPISDMKMQRRLVNVQSRNCVYSICSFWFLTKEYNILANICCVAVPMLLWKHNTRHITKRWFKHIHSHISHIQITRQNNTCYIINHAN